ncbi:phenazine biosynthesis-like domain-containing protein 2 isoform X3 [Phyllopteryx taeniolatus]|uniref:phenazine biosynthesis-like domain-containing protein 2 isoform X3 n=1 Tax=Phyllopteryx taeniolatus TaxID=161469 RepID=UPI002AD52033|nr:phenazine biosynthesis-like domain-containing protein 2 isoform X3 [Phyllopteryx taeniolatus]
MEIPIFMVDAFTNLPFKGNPAAVCLLKHELCDELYQKIAAEINLSETVFISTIKPSEDFTKGSRFRLRWFTPTTEVNLCGHATLASAAVLFKHKKNLNSAVVFETRSGDLSVVQQGEDLVMDFPLNTPTKQAPDHFKDLIKCVLQAAVGDHPVQDVYFSSNTKKLLLRLADTRDRSTLTSLQVNPEALLSSDKSGQVKGLIVTMKDILPLGMESRRILSLVRILTTRMCSCHDCCEKVVQVLRTPSWVATGRRNWERRNCLHSSVPGEVESYSSR